MQNMTANTNWGQQVILRYKQKQMTRKDGMNRILSLSSLKANLLIYFSMTLEWFKANEENFHDRLEKGEQRCWLGKKHFILPLSKASSLNFLKPVISINDYCILSACTSPSKLHRECLIRKLNPSGPLSMLLSDVFTFVNPNSLKQFNLAAHVSFLKW